VERVGGEGNWRQALIYIERYHLSTVEILPSFYLHENLQYSYFFIVFLL
jgi:hypothetical protein